MGKRAETSAATRQRIVEATLELHDAQGITRTSLRDVAGRAGVAPATVLHHFPHMDHLIQACGELSDAMAPMPTEAVMATASNRAQRIHALTAALFEWWEVLGPGWDHLQVDRRTLPRVDNWLREVDERHRQLVAIALGPADAGVVEVVRAMTTRGVWASLRESGIATGEAAARVARLIEASVRGSEARTDSKETVH